MTARFGAIEEPLANGVPSGPGSVPSHDRCDQSHDRCDQSHDRCDQSHDCKGVVLRKSTAEEPK
jgi:hypothetical protein